MPDKDPILAAIAQLHDDHKELRAQNDEQHGTITSALHKIEADKELAHALLEREQNDCKEERELLRDIVIGNGEGGLVEEVHSNSSVVSEIRKFARWIAYGVAAIAGTVILDMILSQVRAGSGP